MGLLALKLRNLNLPVVLFLCISILPASPIFPLVSGSGVLEESAWSIYMAQAESRNLKLLARGKADAFGRIAALTRATAAAFEKLEGRVMFDGDTVVNDLDPTSDNNAAYVLDLAAGDDTTPPPANTAPAQTSTPTGGAVMAGGSSGSTGGETGGETANGAPPTTAPTTAPVAARNSSTNAPTRSPADFRYALRPGTGFTGPTTQPAAVGNTGEVGYDAKAIARWDVVPYQTFTNMFNVGVVAFHREGIDRVEFSVNGGDWTAVRNMTLNPQTDVYEYTATLNAKDFQDGQVEVRAIAYPTVGEARVLAGTADAANGERSLFLNANEGGSLTGPTLYVKPSSGSDSNSGSEAQPFATLSKALRSASNGATVILMEAGTYDPTNTQAVNNSAYITVRPASGLTASDVSIAPPSRGDVRPNVSRLRWYDVTFDWRYYNNYYNYNYQSPDPRMTWWDNCTWTGVSTAGDYATPEGSPHYLTKYCITNSSVIGRRNGIYNSELARNLSITGNRTDVFNNNKLVLNATVSNYFVDDPTPTTHGDLNQFWGQFENIVYAGITVHDARNAQLMFLAGTGAATDYLRDAAFVDIDVRSYTATTVSGSTSYNTTQLFSNLSNVLILRNRNPQTVVYRTDLSGGMRLSANNVVFQDSSLTSATLQATPPSGVSLTGNTLYVP